MKDKKNYGEFPKDGGDTELLSGAASTTDCTGLIPAGSARTEEALDDYGEICSFSAADKQEDIRRSRKRSR